MVEAVTGRRAKVSEATSVSAEPSVTRGVDFAWRTHSAITDWTAKVDTKASIVLSLGVALLGFLVTLSGTHRVFAHLHGWRHVFEITGLCLIAAGVLAAALVVAPRIDRRRARREWRANFVYFGHLRKWDRGDLRAKLQSLSEAEELDVLSGQLITTSRIAWWKHSLLQIAIAFIMSGSALSALAAAWPR